VPGIDERTNMRKYLGLLFLSLLVVSSGCSVAEDTTYLTPIPKATLSAINWEEPITSKLQAVIVARAMLDTTRLHYTEEPQVVSAEELRLEDAQKRIARPGGDASEERPGDTKVWLIIFEGDWQVIPPDPDHTITPDPPSHGCVFAILDANESARTEIGTMRCDPEK
jgi:hypothetical protein